MWRNFSFLHMFHVQKFEISPHDRFFLHGHGPSARVKYQVCISHGDPKYLLTLQKLQMTSAHPPIWTLTGWKEDQVEMPAQLVLSMDWFFSHLARCQSSYQKDVLLSINWYPLTGLKCGLRSCHRGLTVVITHNWAKLRKMSSSHLRGFWPRYFCCGTLHVVEVQIQEPLD